MPLLALILTMLLVTMPVSQCSREPLPILRLDNPLADTLLRTYRELRQAAEWADADSVLSLLAPSDTAILRTLTAQQGYLSLRSYLANHRSGWPDPDTLSIVELTAEAGFARLTLAGMGRRVGPQSDRIWYTGILFRQHNGRWTVAGITGLEKDRYDLFGQKINFHETDYPPRFRFPRHF